MLCVNAAILAQFRVEYCVSFSYFWLRSNFRYQIRAFRDHLGGHCGNSVNKSMA